MSMLQGGVLLPLQYSTFINGFLTKLNLNHSTVKLGDCLVNNWAYADDTVVFGKDFGHLQAILDSCQEHAVLHRFAFNPSKSELLGPPGASVSLSRNSLASLEKFVYLGVTTTRCGIDIEAHPAKCTDSMHRWLSLLRTLVLTIFSRNRLLDLLHF